MICDFIKKTLCLHGYHDFNVVARWHGVDKSITILEEECVRCGEDAYSIVMFAPTKCTCMTRTIAKLPATSEMYIEGTKLGRRAEDLDAKSKKKCATKKPAKAKSKTKA